VRDLEYIQRQSVIEDLKIMLKTVPVVLGAEKGW
jgi:lipopolysaccharide/colanic/teichoic acid biosynthesis glycosyltransferase